MKKVDSGQTLADSARRRRIRDISLKYTGSESLARSRRTSMAIDRSKGTEAKARTENADRPLPGRYPNARRYTPYPRCVTLGSHNRDRRSIDSGETGMEDA